MSEYSLYILRCSDDTYYTGIATDVERRVTEHESGARGAKYLRGRAPFDLVFTQAVGDRSEASRAEYRVKQLARESKQRLIDGRLHLSDLMGDYDSAGADA